MVFNNLLNHNWSCTNKKEQFKVHFVCLTNLNVFMKSRQRKMMKSRNDSKILFSGLIRSQFVYFSQKFKQLVLVYSSVLFQIAKLTWHGISFEYLHLKRNYLLKWKTIRNAYWIKYWTLSNYEGFRDQRNISCGE